MRSRHAANVHADQSITPSGMATLAIACALIILIVSSPLGLIVNGRNLDDLDMLSEIDADGPGAWLLRLSTMLILGGCIFATAVGTGSSRTSTRTGALVFAGYIVFFLTNNVINAVFGTVPSVNIKAAYPLLVLSAIYIQRDNHEILLDVVKTTLAIVLVLSLPLSALLPQLTLRTYAPELRLPFVGFRYWGFGNSPNSTGPLALLLLLLAIHRPFNSIIAQIIVVLSAALTLLLAQSQTAWITALVVLPPYWVYHRYVDDGEQFRDTGGTTWLVLALAVLAIATGLLTFGPGISVDDDAFTGRGRIWRVAIELFKANPLFGYGPAAWETDFRARFDLPFAFSAHNQVLQTLSTAGLLGLGGWVAYLGALVLAAARLARPTRGLAPALLISFPFIRSFSEASFDFKSITADEFILHLTVFIVLASSPQRIDNPTRQAIAIQPHPELH